MILQVNQRGGWQNVIEFSPAKLGQVKEAVKPLADIIAAEALAACAGLPTWRIIQCPAKSPKIVCTLKAAPHFHSSWTRWGR